MAHGIPLDHVIARNLRDLIEERGWRHGDVAARMKVIGFDWSPNRVAQTVTLRRSLTALELAGLCNVLRVGLARLLAGDDPVALPTPNAHGETTIPLAAVRDQIVKGTGRRFGDTEERQVIHAGYLDDLWDVAARRLGVDETTARILAHRLWETDRLVDVRDERVGEVKGLPARSVQAKRGHAMRGMLAEMREELVRLNAEKRRRPR